MIKIAIVDDHKMFTDGVSAVVNLEPGMEVLWTAKSAKETLAKLEEAKPDVILMDIGLGEDNGVVLTKTVLEIDPEINIIAVSMHTEDHYIVKILENGAKGYLLKDGGAHEMINAINAVYKGDTYYSNHVSQILIKHITKGTKPSTQADIPLTKREQEVLALIAREYSNPQIAKELFISIRTVDTHRRNLLDKLDSKNTAGLVKHAIKFGLAEL